MHRTYHDIVWKGWNDFIDTNTKTCSTLVRIVQGYGHIELKSIHMYTSCNWMMSNQVVHKS